jgi:tetratricopeptide (TPR) repeat protein
VDDYTSLIQFQPEVPDYHFHRGRAYEALGDVDKALSDYCDAILSDLKGDYTLQAWAELRARRSGPETLREIANVFEKAIARHPRDKRLQEALRELRQAKTRTWSPPPWTAGLPEKAAQRSDMKHSPE